MTVFARIVTLLLVMSPVVTPVRAQETVTKPYFGIHVIDEQTGRGVPLVELRATNEAVWWTDSAGWVAFHEPDLMDREVFVAVSGPGVEYPKDGFGYRGARLMPKAGATATIKVKRTNIAERLYRITGQGAYRDSELLGLNQPGAIIQFAGVMGQDSVQAVPYRGKIFWLWGDTNLPNYPLGNFHTTSAFSPLPGPKTYQPAVGIPLDYLMDTKQPHRVRGMAPSNEPGPVWLFGLLTVEDADGNEALVAHFARQKSLAETVEQGLVRFDDEAGVFKKSAKLELSNAWRHPRGNAVRVRETDGDYFYFVDAFANTRVKADWKSLIDPNSYEAFAFDAAKKSYRWQRDAAPTTQAEERKLVGEGKLKAAEGHYQLADDRGQTVTAHRSTINFNEFRKKWVMIASEMGQKDSPSLLGEVWYAEADAVTGPWRRAVKIVSHPRYTFYNPRHHVFFDEDGGRMIYFEGTYTREFSGNPVPTPRYDYNQVLYRLDLADPRLEKAR